MRTILIILASENAFFIPKIFAYSISAPCVSSLPGVSAIIILDS
jgi:hypothetical protein